MAKTEWKEAKSDTVSWGKVGDFIEGTLVRVDKKDVKDDVKGIVTKNVYEIKADGGSFHTTDDKKNPIEPPVICEAGDYFTVWGGKTALDNGMTKTKIGQKVRILFAEESEPTKKGYSGFKLMKVFTGPMDESWLAEQSSKEDAGVEANPF